MPRLGHKKSRNGCRQCKARHVKCDENKPCSNCARHGVLCSLVDPNAGPTVPTASAGSSSSNNAPKRTTKVLAERPKKEPSEELSPGSHAQADSAVNPSPATNTTEGDSPSSGSDNFPFLTKFVARRENVHSGLWLKDLELMHHWMAEAADTMAGRADIAHMWKSIGPKIATKFVFFMHELLAFSAFHLAFLNPGRRADYFALGIHHQDHALRGMRKSLQDVTEENASPLFATSTILTLSVFASRGQDALQPTSHPQNAIDDLVDIFSLIQGIGIVVGSAQRLIITGPFAPVWQDPTHETPPQPMFAQLLERLPALTAFLQDHENLDEEVRRELVGFVALIRENVLRSSKPCIDNRELRFLFYWPLHLSANFLHLLRLRHGGALVVLMHYAVVLYAADPHYWFLTGWADRSMRAISEEVVDAEWRVAIQWPLRLIEIHSSMSPPPALAPPTQPGEAETGVPE